MTAMTEIEDLISSYSAGEIEQAEAPLPRVLRPVVQALSAAHQPLTVCTGCPQSLWFRSASDLRCYCRLMHLITWSRDEQNNLTDCDQLHLPAGEVTE